MRRLGLLLLLLAACGGSEPAGETTTVDDRQPVAVEYIRPAELEIRSRPSADAPVVTKYQNSESVSVLSKRNGWAEIRMPSGSGWAREADLSTAAEATKAEEDNTSVRFKVPPDPVTEPGAHGALVLEASVNAEGEVTAVRVVSNTTGSQTLQEKNAGSLQRARFYPIVRHGDRTPFTYEQRVHY